MARGDDRPMRSPRQSPCTGQPRNAHDALGWALLPSAGTQLPGTAQKDAGRRLSAPHNPTNCSRRSSTGGHVLGKKQRDLKSEGLGKTEVPSLSGNSPQVDEGSRWVVLPPLAHGSHRQFLPTGRREAGHTLSFSVKASR